MGGRCALRASRSAWIARWRRYVIRRTRRGARTEGASADLPPVRSGRRPIRGSLRVGANDDTVRHFGRDDDSLGMVVVRGQWILPGWARRIQRPWRVQRSEPLLDLSTVG